MARLAGSRRDLPGLLHLLGLYRVGSPGHQPHRETHGLRVFKRGAPEPVFPGGRSLAGRAIHQLLLFRPFHHGIFDPPHRDNFQHRLQPVGFVGAGDGGHGRIRAGQQSHPPFRRQPIDGSWIRSDRACPTASGREPGRGVGVHSRPRVGRRWLLGVDRSERVGSGRGRV